LFSESIRTIVHSSQPFPFRKRNTYILSQTTQEWVLPTNTQRTPLATNRRPNNSRQPPVVPRRKTAVVQVPRRTLATVRNHQRRPVRHRRTITNGMPSNPHALNIQLSLQLLVIAAVLINITLGLQLLVIATVLINSRPHALMVRPFATSPMEDPSRAVTMPK
jgi:hypothetical protein